ncbi:MAG: cadherin-like beta sandwich domain-containing protein [Clostridia bacterium]|nr:cadherin-like beta sandwich domain-containing protein [Clostridia bacterium]
MKKLTVLLLALILLCAAVLPAQAANLDQYASAKFGKNYPVYSGPGENYYRANSGKALYGSGGTARVYGVTGNWILIGYQLSNGDYRIGYIAKEAINYMTNIKGDINYNLTFDNILMYTKTAVPITDDPIIKCKGITTLAANTPVTLLATMEQWAYIEVQDGPQKMRGFVKADYLVSANGTGIPTAAPVYPIVTPMPTVRPYVTPAPTTPVYYGNSMLSSLKHNCPNTGVMLPSYFSPYQDTYLLTVADWVSRVTFTPTAYDPNAVITVNGQTVKSGKTSQIINMTDKPQAVTIKVQSGGSATTYTVYLQRRPSEKRTRVSAGYISNIYSKNNEWHLVADLGTISYLSEDYSTGSRSTFENKTADSYDYVLSPNCLFYYGNAQNPIRLNTVNEFMAYYRTYGSTLYTIVYIEDEIVAVMPYSPDGAYYY